LLNLYLTLDAFPEVRDTLARLKQAGIRTAILSNGSPPMLKAAVQGAQINHLLDAVLSVEEVGIYKPHPRVYQLAVDRLGLEAGAIAFQSSNAWDAYAASAFGMRVCGVTATSSVPKDSRAGLITKSGRWPNCRRC